MRKKKSKVQKQTNEKKKHSGDMILCLVYKQGERARTFSHDVKAAIINPLRIELYFNVKSKTCSDHSRSLNLFLFVPGSTSQLHL